MLEAMGAPIPSDSDSESSVGETPSDCTQSSSQLTPSNDSPENTSGAGSKSSPTLSGLDGEQYVSPVSTDGAGFGETRPKFVRSESGSRIKGMNPGKVPQVVEVQDSTSPDTSGVGGSRPPLLRSESASSVESVKLDKLPQVAEAGESRPSLLRSKSGSSVNRVRFGNAPQTAEAQGPSPTDSTEADSPRPPFIRSESGSSVNTVKLGRATELATAQRPASTNSNASGGSRPKLIRSESGPSVSRSKFSKSPQIEKVRRPKSSSNPLPPSNIRPFMRSAIGGSPSKLGGPSRLGVSQLHGQSSIPEPSSKVSHPRRLLTRPFHQLIHSGRKRDWKSPVSSDPPGIEDIEVPFVEKFRVDSSVLLPSVLKIFEDDPEPKLTKGKGIVPGTGSDDNGRSRSKARRKSRAVSRSFGQEGSLTTRRATEGDAGQASNRGRAQKAGAETVIADTRDLPPALASNGPNRKPKNPKAKIAQFEVKQEDNDYHPRGASVDLEPIPENRPLRIPQTKLRANAEPQRPDHDPNDPLLTWYFPRRSPDYWEMLDDVAKMFEDLHLQEVTLKHFQRPIDYVTVLLCLSNVVFAEMFQTLQEKVTDGTYRIEFAANGRTGVNLYLSAYSREHIYIAKSLAHKVNAQLDLAKKHSPRSTIQYIHLIECVERVLVHDRRKSWGRVPDGAYSTYTDIDSPAVVHEVGVAESRAELYRRCRRYLQDVPSVNLAVAVKVDSSECEWAELLVLARDASDDSICKVFNWVRFWGEGAVNSGELRYYPSDFLEVEDRWKIPRAHMRPLDILDGPRSVALTSGVRKNG